MPWQVCRHRKCRFLAPKSSRDKQSHFNSQLSNNYFFFKLALCKIIICVLKFLKYVRYIFSYRTRKKIAHIAVGNIFYFYVIFTLNCQDRFCSLSKWRTFILTRNNMLCLNCAVTFCSHKYSMQWLKKSKQHLIKCYSMQPYVNNSLEINILFPVENKHSWDP